LISSLFLLLAIATQTPPPPVESTEPFLPLLDTSVVVEKADGSTAAGKLVALSPTSVTVRVKDLRLLEIPRSDVVAITASEAPTRSPASEEVAKREPNKTPRTTVEAPQDRKRQVRTENARAARRKLELSEKTLAEAEAAAMNATVGAAVGAGLGCAMCGAWAFVLAFPPLVIGGGIGLVTAAITGIVAAVQWTDVGTKRAAVERNREALRDATGEMEY
jgi:hypothetical protein